MVFRTSTNGTSATAQWKVAGLIFMEAPIKRPPALPPWIVIFPEISLSFKNSAHEIKSLKLF